MYAIVDIAGQQFKVEKDQKIFVHRLSGEEGETVQFDRVLLIESDDKVLVGEPLIDGAMVSGKILAHPKGDKIIVFKKKRRKGYKVRTGHRQYLTQVLIEEIVESGASRVAKPQKEKKAPVTETATGQAPAAEPTATKESQPLKEEAARKEVKKSAEKKAEPAAKKVAAEPGTKKVAAKKAAPAKKAPEKKATDKPAAKKSEPKPKK